QPPITPGQGQGFQGPPNNWIKPGTGIGTTDQKGQKGSPQFQKKGPVVVTPSTPTLPQGSQQTLPQGSQKTLPQGTQQQLLKKGPVIAGPTQTGPTQTVPSTSSGFQGPPAGWAKPGTGITTTPTTRQQMK